MASLRFDAVLFSEIENAVSGLYMAIFGGLCGARPGQVSRRWKTRGTRKFPETEFVQSGSKVHDQRNGRGFDVLVRIP